MWKAMKGLVLKGLKGPKGEGQKGFTLVELLVVVGIIVALSAVIVPSVAQFASRGDTGAQAAELDSVQAAFDTLMADEGVIAVTAPVTATGPYGSPAGANDWTFWPAYSGTQTLSDYLRNSTTTYTYCWDAAGIVTQTAVACP